jgi:FtsZ-binding cell division protein ZapB
LRNVVRSQFDIIKDQLDTIDMHNREIKELRETKASLRREIETLRRKAGSEDEKKIGGMAEKTRRFKKGRGVN